MAPVHYDQRHWPPMLKRHRLLRRPRGRQHRYLGQPWNGWRSDATGAVVFIKGWGHSGLVDLKGYDWIWGWINSNYLWISCEHLEWIGTSWGQLLGSVFFFALWISGIHWFIMVLFDEFWLQLMNRMMTICFVLNGIGRDYSWDFAWGSSFDRILDNIFFQDKSVWVRNIQQQD